MNAAPPSAAHPEAAGFQVEDLAIDVRTRRVLRNGIDLGVTGLSFDLLLALVRAAPGIVTFDALMERVWPGIVVSPETLTQRVKLLRQALGDNASDPRYIIAVRGHGYRLRSEAAPLGGSAPSAAPAAHEAPMSAGRWRFATAALILLSGVVCAWWVLAPGTNTRPTRDVDAYPFYLQAESVVNGTPESFLAAISLYDQALARDPGFARALSGRAMSRAALEWTASPLGRGLDEAQRDAEKALSLDPSDARARAVLASMSAMRGEWRAAEAGFRSAIDTGSRGAEFRVRYAATLLLPTGQVRKATAELAQAQDLEPGSPFAATMRAFAEHARGADAEAVELAERAVSRGGDPRQLVPVYVSAATRRGNHREAADHLIRMLPPAIIDAGGAATLRQAYDALGDAAQRPAALAALRALTSGPTWESATPRIRQSVIYLYAALGAVDDFYDEMSRMLGQGTDAYPQIIAVSSLWSPEMRAFRQDRRFQGMAERLGLIDYWKQAGPPDACTLVGASLVCS